VEGDKFDGQGIKKGEIIKHLEELRALGYQIIANVCMGNARASLKTLNEEFQELAEMLLYDSKILIKILDKVARDGGDSLLS